MIAHLVVGPEGHGVTRCALDLHDTAALRDEPLVRVLDGTSGDLAGISLPGRVSVHVHVTDRLFGRSAPEAADRLEPLLRAHPTTVTLHDVPQPSDGEGPIPGGRTPMPGSSTPPAASSSAASTRPCCWTTRWRSRADPT